jgi:hypothetical protein
MIPIDKNELDLQNFKTHMHSTTMDLTVLTLSTTEKDPFVPAAARKMMLSGSNTSSSSKEFSAIDLVPTETSKRTDENSESPVDASAEEYAKPNSDSKISDLESVYDPVRRLPVTIPVTPPKIFYATWWRHIAHKLSAKTQQFRRSNIMRV